MMHGIPFAVAINSVVLSFLKCVALFWSFLMKKQYATKHCFSRKYIDHQQRCIQIVFKIHYDCVNFQWAKRQKWNKTSKQIAINQRKVLSGALITRFYHVVFSSPCATVKIPSGNGYSFRSECEFNANSQKCIQTFCNSMLV